MNLLPSYGLFNHTMSVTLYRTLLPSYGLFNRIYDLCLPLIEMCVYLMCDI